MLSTVKDGACAMQAQIEDDCGLNGKDNEKNDTAGFLCDEQGILVSPIKCVKYEIHNMLTALRLSNAHTGERFMSQTDSKNLSPLLRSFQTLFDSLSFLNEFHIDITHLQPFLKVIVCPTTSGEITARALSAINKFLSYGLLLPFSSKCSHTINVVAKYVISCKFQASLTPQDEVVLIRIVEVLRDTLNCSAGFLLTDDAVWRIVKKVFQISRQPRGSHLLKASAENILAQIVMTIFTSRRREPPNARTSGVGSQKAALVSFSTRYPPYGSNVMYRVLRFLSYIVSTESKRTSSGGETNSQSNNTKSGEDNGVFCIEKELASIPIAKEEYKDATKTLGLTLLNIALETGGAKLAKQQLIVQVIQDDLCKTLLQVSRTDSLDLLSVTLRCVFYLFVYFRKHLKVQFEIFFNSIHLRLAGCNDGGATPEQRELALESILDFCREPGLVMELYENYDCDVRCTNLLESLVKLFAQQTSSGGKPLGGKSISKTSGTQSPFDCPGTSFTPINRLALFGLLAVINAIAIRCHVPDSSVTKPTVMSTKGATRDLLDDEAQINKERRSPSERKDESLTVLRRRKEKKKSLAVGAQLFNTEPNKCIEPLQKLGLLPIPVYPSDFAIFLKETPGLDMRILGEYISKDKEWNSKTREAFVKSNDFTCVPIVEALRLFLAQFRLPGEAQMIERLMESFAKHYFCQQPLVDGLTSFSQYYDSILLNETNEILKGEVEEKNKKKENIDGLEINGVDFEKERLWPRYAISEKALIDVIRVGEDETVIIPKKIEEWRKRSISALADRPLKFFRLSQYLAKTNSKEEPDEDFVVIANSDTFFVLSYSIIMLNTDLHNQQVKHKMTKQEFIRNNRGINDGQDLPCAFLSQIYDAISLNEIRLYQDTGQCIQADDSYWDHVLRKKELLEEYSTLSQFRKAGIHERDMALLIWDAGALSTISKAFQGTQDLSILCRCLEGFWEFALMSSYFSQLKCLNSVISVVSGYVNYWCTARAQLVMPLFFHFLSRFVDGFRCCWSDVIEVLLKLYSLNLITGPLDDLDDFTDPSEENSIRLCRLQPPPINIVKKGVPFEKKENTIDKRNSGNTGWLGDLASILFSSSSSDEENEGEEAESDSCENSFDTARTIALLRRTQHHGSPRISKEPLTPLGLSLMLFKSISHCTTHDGRNNPAADTDSQGDSSQAQRRSEYDDLKVVLQRTFKLNDLLFECFGRMSIDSCAVLVRTLISLSVPKIALQTKAGNEIGGGSSHTSPLPFEWGMCLKPDMQKIDAFRKAADPIFCLELLINLVTLRVSSNRTNHFTTTDAYNFDDQLEKNKNGDSINTWNIADHTRRKAAYDSIWLPAIQHLDAWLRRYIIPGENSQGDSIPTPVQISLCIDKMLVLHQSREETHHDVVAPPPTVKELEMTELMYLERLVVNTLRLAIRLTHTYDTHILAALIELLRLLACFHPSVFALHSGRITLAIQTLACSSSYLSYNPHGVQVLFCLLQRCIPHPSFMADPKSLESIKSPVCHSETVVDFLISWITDDNYALMYLSHPIHYKALLQTVIVAALFGSVETPKASGLLVQFFTLLLGKIEQFCDPKSEEARQSLTHNQVNNFYSPLRRPTEIHWVVGLHSLAIISAFSKKDVRASFLQLLQHMLTKNIFKNDIKGNWLWALVVRYVLLPLINYRFTYPFPFDGESGTFYCISTDTELVSRVKEIRDVDDCGESTKQSDARGPLDMPTSFRDLLRNDWYDFLVRDGKTSRRMLSEKDGEVIFFEAPKEKDWMSLPLQQLFSSDECIEHLVDPDELEGNKGYAAGLVCKMFLKRLEMVKLLGGNNNFNQPILSTQKTDDFVDKGTKVTVDKETPLDTLQSYLPPLFQFFGLLNEEAASATSVNKDAFLEVFKNTVLVLATADGVMAIKELPSPTTDTHNLEILQDLYDGLLERKQIDAQTYDSARERFQNDLSAGQRSVLALGAAVVSDTCPEIIVTLMSVMFQAAERISNQNEAHDLNKTNGTITQESRTSTVVANDDVPPPPPPPASLPSEANGAIEELQ